MQLLLELFNLDLFAIKIIKLFCVVAFISHASMSTIHAAQKAFSNHPLKFRSKLKIFDRGQKCDNQDLCHNFDDANNLTICKINFQ